jgi:hypothetical protein
VTNDTPTEDEEGERSPPYQESQDSNSADDGDGDSDGDDSPPSAGGNVAGSSGVGILSQVYIASTFLHTFFLTMCRGDSIHTCYSRPRPWSTGIIEENSWTWT